MALIGSGIVAKMLDAFALLLMAFIANLIVSKLFESVRCC